jgi:Raf kinase inhibitor-like YbhB/YbcL family protein
MSLQLSIPAFEQGEMIPDRYTCKGQDISPALNWAGLPEETRSLALICDDPDAPMGTWVHWVIFNIPADTEGLPEDIPSSEATLASGAAQGTNSWGRMGYGGPCPPSGTHRYFFRLYALDNKLDLKPEATKAQVLNAMEGHILAECELMGRYFKS